MRPLTTADPVGTRVLYSGRPDPVLVTERTYSETGHILGEHHPGVITDVDREDGVCVSFVGLESEPVCGARFAPDRTGRVPGLLAVTDEEWVAAGCSGWWAGLAG